MTTSVVGPPNQLAYETTLPPPPSRDRLTWPRMLLAPFSACTVLFLLLAGGPRPWPVLVSLWSVVGVNVFLFLWNLRIKLFGMGGGPNTVARGLLALVAAMHDPDTREPVPVPNGFEWPDAVWLAETTGRLQRIGYRVLADMHLPNTVRLTPDCRGAIRLLLSEDGRTLVSLAELQVSGRSARVLSPDERIRRAASFSSGCDANDSLSTTNQLADEHEADPPFDDVERLPDERDVVALAERHAERLREWATTRNVRVLDGLNDALLRMRESSERHADFLARRGWLRGPDVERVAPNPRGRGRERVADELERIWHHETRPALIAAGLTPVDTVNHDPPNR